MNIREEIVSSLRCPVCGSPLGMNEKSLVCSGSRGKRHCFDLSASGYCDLSRRQGGSGDPKSCVADRTAFLDAGYYAPLAQRIRRLVTEYADPRGLLADEGCGEGYYSECIAAALTEGFVVGADLSKFAVDRASKRRNAAGRDNSFYCVASVFEMPLADGCAASALCMYSPVAEAENRRILRRGGVLIIGSAGPEHLIGLKEAIYDDVYLNEPRSDLPKEMKLAYSCREEYEIRVEGQSDIRRLFGMTPYRFRTPAAAYERLCALESVTTTVQTDFAVYVNE